MSGLPSFPLDEAALTALTTEHSLEEVLHRYTVAARPGPGGPQYSVGDVIRAMADEIRALRDLKPVLDLLGDAEEYVDWINCIAPQQYRKLADQRGGVAAIAAAYLTARMPRRT